MLTMSYDKVPANEIFAKTVEALESNGFNPIVVDSVKNAKAKVLSLIPEGSEVMTMTSVTLDQSGISEVINESDKYISAKNKLYAMSRETAGNEMNKIGAATEYTLGSAHAVTQDGKIVIASNTGSQLPAYAYSSSNVIFVVGGQKIVKDLDQAMDRIYTHTLPLESERAKKAYGVSGSNVSKLLILNKEVNTERIKIILIKEAIGF